MLKPLAVLAALFTVALSAPSLAHEFKLGDLTVDHPWARATIGQVPNGAAYMTITTQGPEADRLVAVASDVARRVELHTHLLEDGVMKMRPVTALEVAPGEPTLLKPGGLHVMLIGLKSPLVQGETFKLTLIFARAGELEVEVNVEAADEMGDGHGTMEGHGAGHGS